VLLGSKSLRRGETTKDEEKKYVSETIHGGIIVVSLTDQLGLTPFR